MVMSLRADLKGRPRNMRSSALKKEVSSFDIMSGEFGKKTYSDSYLKKICDKIGSTDKEKRDLFSDRIRYAGGQYLNLVRLNKERPQPYKQNKAFDKYKKALEQTRKSYKEILGSSVTAGKLRHAVWKRYEQTEPVMKQMFQPYCDETSMRETLFENFLDELIRAAEEAKLDNLGTDRADPSGEYFTQWITVIGKYWPEDARIKFALGKYDKEESIYTSSCIPILQDIVHQIEPDVSIKEIETTLRKIISEKLLNQRVANFLLK
jgi:hypothetical protein